MKVGRAEGQEECHRATNSLGAREWPSKWGMARNRKWCGTVRGDERQLSGLWCFGGLCECTVVCCAQDASRAGGADRGLMRLLYKSAEMIPMWMSHANWQRQQEWLAKGKTICRHQRWECWDSAGGRKRLSLHNNLWCFTGHIRRSVQGDPTGVPCLGTTSSLCASDLV